MRKNLFRRLSLVVAATIGLAASVPALAQDKLNVRLDWTPWGMHAAFHLAQQKGWYKKANLDVSMEDGNGSVTTVQLLGSSDQFDVGNAALASMMIARDKGLPLKAVAVFARLSDVGMLAPSDSNIKGPGDLKGKKVAYTAGSLEAPFIDAFLAAGKLKRDDVELINVDAASKASTYAVGRTDTAFSSVPFFLAVVSQNRPSIGIRFADYGLNTPSFGLFTSEAKLKAKGPAISRFASVTARTWEYIFAGHQDEAVDAIVAQRPQARLDKKVLRGQIDALQAYFTSPASKGQRLGVIIPADWKDGVATMTKVNLVKPGVDPASYYATGLVKPEEYDAMVAK